MHLAGIEAMAVAIAYTGLDLMLRLARTKACLLVPGFSHGSPGRTRGVQRESFKAYLGSCQGTIQVASAI